MNRKLFRLAPALPWMVALALCWAGSASATVVTFNWPSPPGWTAGTPTTGQTKSQVFSSFYTNDVTVAIANSGVTFQASYPQISTNSTTGGTGVNGLQLYASSSSAVSSYIQTTVTFSTPVINLTFQIWDVDKSAGQFVDKIANIQALDTLGGTVGANSVTSEVAGFNSISGSGLSTVVLGTAGASNTTNQGTIDITFTGPITQFSFQWSNNDPGLGAQAIGFGSIIYTPVPETSVHYLAGLTGLLAIGFDRVRRGRMKKRTDVPRR